MAQRPQDTVVHAPAEKGSENCADTAEDSPATTPTTGPFFLFSHVFSILGCMPARLVRKTLCSLKGSEWWTFLGLTFELSGTDCWHGRCFDVFGCTGHASDQ